MGRRARKPDELFYDQFYAMDTKDQEIALRIMSEHHRLALKQAKQPAKPEKETVQD